MAARAIFGVHMEVKGEAGSVNTVTGGEGDWEEEGEWSPGPPWPPAGGWG